MLDNLLSKYADRLSGHFVVVTEEKEVVMFTSLGSNLPYPGSGVKGGIGSIAKVPKVKNC